MSSPAVRRMPTPPPPPPSRRVEGPSDSEVLAAVDAGVQMPLVEDAHGGTDAVITFVWVGRADAVSLGINRVTHTDADTVMRRIVGSDVWRASFSVPREWRGSYGFLVRAEGAGDPLAGLGAREAMRAIRETGCTDPRNPRVEGTHLGPGTSWAQGPQAPAEPWLERRAPLPAPVELMAPGARRVWVHEPSGLTGTRPVIVVHDGQVWHRSGRAVEQVEAMAAAGLAGAPTLVLLDSGTRAERMRDLSIDGDASDYVATQLLPWIRERFDVASDPAHVAVSGESLGGLTALRTAFEHPQTVGLALAQSSSLWQDDLGERLAALPDDAGTRAFVTAGSFEQTLVAHNRELAAKLEERGFLERFVEFQGGHDFTCWRGWWGAGVHSLFGTHPGAPA